ncbi:MAG: glycosyl hydrolase [Mucilaginibacter polytrichastri]|nr:glycosyl hydrolase [Mucilaginibacter polytrichastri]
MRFLALLFGLFLLSEPAFSQQIIEFNSGWRCAPKNQVKTAPEKLAQPDFSLQNWKPAVVPGTVLTTMLENKEIPDPFYGMNNEKIKDIYETGRDHYTYWFVKDFELNISASDEYYLNLRGVNYSCDVYLNGKKLNPKTHYGMFLRQQYRVSDQLKKGKNRLAVIVYPPDPVGNPNGGQGGDGTIARNVSHQYVAGWDWIQPMRDRNTGIWDKVTLERTGAVNVLNPKVVTRVPGIRHVDGRQAPAFISVSCELDNAKRSSVSGTLFFDMAGKSWSKKVTLKPASHTEIFLGENSIENPKLWWPNTYGPQYLYPANIRFVTADGTTSDQEKLNVGIREIQTSWNARTRSREIAVNGQKVFIKGGNWIVSDAMLRFTDARYDAEVRFHRDMNLNLIRVWGGALTERPEFFDACDKYGLLVMQDFWGSGDCNGRWFDPMKKDDQWTRRAYPDDHQLFLTSARDMVKMIRNHPSLAMWCGGNEITLPQDILKPLRDTILVQLDGTRWFIDYSNSDEMSYNDLGGNGDGPYGIQPVSKFWEFRTWPFNSEIGSVGVGDMESLERFMPKENLVLPEVKSMEKTGDDLWNYHKYISYEKSLEPYGKPKDLKDFTEKAQLVNYDQYRQMLEGFSAHMWDWYTGMIIWKTQNPWTAMRGQMYDYYLDPNACLYGLRKGSESLHPMYNPVDQMVMITNNSFETVRDKMLEVHVMSIDGKDSLITQVFCEVGPSRSKKILPLKNIADFTREKGAFLVLKLRDVDQSLITQNIYWLADEKDEYSGLQKMASTKLGVSAKLLSPGKIRVELRNPAGGPIAFFNRISVLDPASGKRILPSFYDENYVSVLPGDKQSIMIDFPAGAKPQIEVRGWNTGVQRVGL